ncbi:hypothetical protein [Nannocystis sp.]|uniref:hypothetical protein n=1 Tax=Nannocystis sp. TaxID=1962667 RepID=UPI0025CD8743|nr:hypothetical protein [Nannocystis sp.]
MNINVGIIDQHVLGIAQRCGDRIDMALDDDGVGKNRPDAMIRSAAFVVLCVKTMLDLMDEEAIATLTEGGNDFGVDAIAIGDIVDGEFTVTLVQASTTTRTRGCEGLPPRRGREGRPSRAGAVQPRSPVDLNKRLQAQIEEIRSLILDGNIPRIRFLLCNNGAPWKVPESQAIIDREKFGDRVRFEHVNHDKPRRDPAIHRAGKGHAAIPPANRSSRTLIMPGFPRQGARVRARPAHGRPRGQAARAQRPSFPGSVWKRLNAGIRGTLRSETERANFYFTTTG